MNAVIERVYLPTETLGSFYWNSVMQCKTMELPWKQNAHGISCIPEKIYVVVKELWTVKHPYPHFRILGVDDRDGILIHRITFVSGLRGCVGVGTFKDINGDKVPDMIQSTAALEKLVELLPTTFKLDIRKKLWNLKTGFI